MDELENANLFDGVRELSCSGDVGLESLPHQIVKKRTEGGFMFNILLIGETGIGKSTLVSALFHVPHHVSTDTHIHSEVKLKPKTYNLHEKGVNLKLTVVETTGYGDQVNRNGNAQPIISYVESQFEQYFQEEFKLKRSLEFYDDTRIHACLYFICPTGHNLKSLDLFCMKQLHDKVNIIPIVAKSDSLSKEELRKFKAAINAEIEKENVRIYRFPTDDDEIALTNRKSSERVPFAIAASGDYARVGETLARARVFPWGTMLVESEEHSEFSILKQALVEVNMEDLRERTHSQFYENYRRVRMLQLGFPECSDEASLAQLYQEKREQHRREMLEKEEQLKQRFVDKVNAKEAELKALEETMHAEYNEKFENLEKDMQRNRDLMTAIERETLMLRSTVKN